MQIYCLRCKIYTENNSRVVLSAPWAKFNIKYIYIENIKNICQNQIIQYIPNNEIKNIRTQYCKLLSKSCYY